MGVKGGSSVTTIGLAVNKDKTGALKFAKDIVFLLEQKGCKVIVEPFVGDFLGRAELVRKRSDFPKEAQLMFVLGGDGTLLGIARDLCSHSLPILGINLGNLGFLSEAEPQDLPAAVENILQGNYRLENRMMIQAELFRKGKKLEEYHTLNDICIARGTFSRMIKCATYVGDLHITTFTGDGLIVSTPTGSTAYSLSAGGPIVAPDIQLMIITPIAPHSLTSRPMIVSGEEVMRIVIDATHQDIGFTVDGQIGCKLEVGDEILIRKSQYQTTLIKWPESSFFDVVRKKLMGEYP